MASLNAGPVMVARPGIGAIVTLLPKASVASVVLATSLRAPVVTDVPKEEIAGAVAPGGSCGASIPVVEHLTGLGRLPDAGFRFFAVPVKFRGLGTFPVRAFGIISRSAADGPLLCSPS